MERRGGPDPALLSRKIGPHGAAPPARRGPGSSRPGRPARRLRRPGQPAGAPGRPPRPRSWCRSATAGCWPARSPTTGARPCRWPRPGRACPPPAWPPSSAATRTCPTSGSTRRRQRRPSSTSTTSTRPLPGPWEWDVKRLAAPASRSRPAGNGLAAQRRPPCITVAAVARYRAAMRELRPAQPTSDVWYAHVERRSCPPPCWRERVARPGVAAALTPGGRTPDNAARSCAKLTRFRDGQPAVHLRARRCWSRSTSCCAPGSRTSPSSSAPGHARLHGHAAERPPSPCWTASNYVRPGPPGGRGGQRGDALLRGPAARPRRRRPALPAGEGGPGPRPASEFTGPAPVRPPGPAGGGRPAADAGRQRHLPGLAHRRRRPAGTSRDYYVRQLRDRQAARQRSHPWTPPPCAATGSCAGDPARPHARPADRIAIAAYLGGSDVFYRTIADLPVLYAHQNERDLAALATARKPPDRRAGPH